ncbi:MAG: hypothetical protein N4A49_01860 [Marinifilaceae bacterium]|jgi:uncharacterized membrane protein|nr:hypothetical protein [Marinifilaceae bacterium]
MNKESIAIAIIGAVAGWLLSVFPQILKLVSNTIPNNKRKKQIVTMAIRYIILSFLIVLICLYFSSSNWSLLALSLLLILISFFIARDYFNYTILKVSFNVEKELLTSKKNSLVTKLCHCKPNNFKEHEKLKNQIVDIEKKLKSL